MVVCKHVVYHGRVQGVGFRYTACRIADEFGVEGYVRNLPSGAVELVVEGENEVVVSFLAAVAQRMAGYISQTSEQDEAAGRHKGFQIRH
jgi:acylphosphatase